MRNKYDKKGKLINDSFRDMYDSLTNQETIQENVRLGNIKKQKEQRRTDTGL